MTIFYCLRFETPLEGQVPVFIYSRNRVAQIYPQALGSIFVASYNSQSMVEVFEPASTRSRIAQVKVKVTLKLAVYRQSVRLGAKPLETHDQRLFFNRTLAITVLM
jgi:hypothetical protein